MSLILKSNLTNLMKIGRWESLPKSDYKIKFQSRSVHSKMNNSKISLSLVWFINHNSNVLFKSLKNPKGMLSKNTPLIWSKLTIKKIKNLKFWIKLKESIGAYKMHQ